MDIFNSSCTFCIIAPDVYFSVPTYTVTNYYNITLGIKDPTVFTPPEICLQSPVSTLYSENKHVYFSNMYKLLLLCNNFLVFCFQLHRLNSADLFSCILPPQMLKFIEGIELPTASLSMTQCPVPPERASLLGKWWKRYLYLLPGQSGFLLFPLFFSIC